MDSSSDEISSSDEEMHRLAGIASQNITENSSDEKMSTGDSESDDSDADDSLGYKTSLLKNEDDLGLFTIDRKPTNVLDQKRRINISNISEPTTSKSRKRGRRNRNKNKQNDKNDEFQLASEIGAGMELPGIYINVKPGENTKHKNEEMSKLQKNRSQKELKVMEKSVITPDFERTETLPKYHESVRKVKREKKKLREMTKGKKWFDLPATGLTEEKKNSLMVLQMRKALDPKRFYKSNDLKDFPKYFQFGKVVEGAADFYSGRIPKKQRKQTIVDELLADAEFRTYNKRKFEEIQSSMRRGTGAYQGSKRMMQKKKGPVRRQPDKKQKKFFVDSSAFSKRRRR
ncbi:deoxynucleotidyltransferase terminal-interacting protein 2 [Patella vulgata]|uniref:deoxynucleotidyltransferase terminal-interacting protein 2 n=1 Tax=Patella vulgata TaxID=6465 RepID=UPI0021807D84|nr:deoxynucleotidyltransferase terminal-interacting protein 2 [Patella vulgata]